MKILVNELPKTPKECLFNYHHPGTRQGCCKLSETSDTFETCKLGTEGFKCPYLKEFNGEAVNYHTLIDGTVTGYTKIPIELKGD